MRKEVLYLQIEMMQFFIKNSYLIISNIIYFDKVFELQGKRKRNLRVFRKKSIKSAVRY